MLSDRRYASDFQLMMDFQNSDFEITNIVISYQVCDHTVVALCTHFRVETEVFLVRCKVYRVLDSLSMID